MEPTLDSFTVQICMQEVDGLEIAHYESIEEFKDAVLLQLEALHCYAEYMMPSKKNQLS